MDILFSPGHMQWKRAEGEHHCQNTCRTTRVDFSLSLSTLPLPLVLSHISHISHIYSTVVRTVRSSGIWWRRLQFDTVLLGELLLGTEGCSSM
jgi:hypothetical protein